MKIMIADDDPAIVDALTLILKDEGYSVSSTTSGEYISFLEKESPDLILLDIYMSGVDGRKIVRLLKEKGSTKNLPVLMVSASTNVEDSVYNAGADDFLQKPFEIEELLYKIKHLIGQS